MVRRCRHRRVLAVAVGLLVLVLAVFEGSALAAPQPVGDGQVVTANVYLHSQVGEPWGQADNDVAMNSVFGPDAWEEEFFETVNVGTGSGGLFAAGVRFIFLDGSDSGANELEAFLSANESKLKSFVDAGGRLIVNSAPNEGDGMTYDGRQIVYSPDFSANVVAASGAHPIFNGPSTPAGTSYTGGYFGHALVTGPGLTPLILRTVGDATGGAGDPSAVVLAEYPSGGGGITLLGGMTMPSFHGPAPNAQNLRNNIVHYAANVSLAVANDDARTVAENSGATSFNVLSNDSGASDITSVSDPANGTTTVVQGSGGSPDQVSYTPDANYCNSANGAAPDTFTYTITGGDTATVSVTVTCTPCPNGAAVTIRGTTGADPALNGTGGNDVIDALGGDDTVNAGAGNDTVCGDDGNDTLRGGNGNDSLFGENGQDSLFGEADDDTLNGGAARDTGNGGPGTDSATNVEKRINIP